MMEIWTTITVECAHSSPSMGVPQIHGHSYWLQFFCLTSAMDPYPLAELQAAAEQIRATLDHRNLDEIMQFTTMESIIDFALSKWIGADLSRVVVRRDSLGCGVEWQA